MNLKGNTRNMKDTRQITFTVNKQVLATIDQLKEDFNVDTVTAVLRRALALARVAAQNANDDHTITIIDKNNERQKILLTG